jgi:hypothetical protein
MPIVWRQLFAICLVWNATQWFPRYGRAQAAPAEPYVVRGACPFECCQYGRWVTRVPVPVYSHERASGRPLFRLRAGDTVEAITGNVHMVRVGRVVVDRSLPGNWVEDDSLPAPAPGDTVYVLNYQGEGYRQYWYRGRTGSGPEFWEPESRHDSLPPPARLIQKPISRWWVQVKVANGQEGWLRMPEAGFDGYDACG